ncbi:MAG: hypothetical protein JXA24_05435 [Proteobacteria bacterium]|nr:hypothetical protein [Pseudomonadota bacterium]
MDSFGEFARYYRAFFTYTDDMPFWRYAARRYANDKPILYIGPGAGRVMLELLSDYEIIGVERSDGMFAELKSVLDRASDDRTLKRYELINKDIRDVKGKIDSCLAIMPCNVISENHNKRDVSDILRTVASVMGERARIAFHVDNAASFSSHREMTVEKHVDIGGLFSGRRRTWIQRDVKNDKLIVEIELLPDDGAGAERLVRFEHCAMTYKFIRDVADELGLKIDEMFGSPVEMCCPDPASASIAVVMRNV